MKFIANKKDVLRKKIAIFVVFMTAGILALSSFYQVSGVEAKTGAFLSTPETPKPQNPKTPKPH